MIIRKAEASEFAKLAELNKKLIQDERHPNPMNEQQLAERMKEWLHGEYSCYVAEESQETIATEFLDWMYDHVWNEKKVRLDVLSHNEEAIAFYKAYGFRAEVATRSDRWAIRIKEIRGMPNLLDIAVLPSYQGRGLGKRLMKDLIRDCDAKGFERISSRSFKSNQPSIRLHRSLSFKKCRITDDSIVWELRVGEP